MYLLGPKYAKVSYYESVIKKQVRYVKFLPKVNMMFVFIRYLTVKVVIHKKIDF